MPDDDAPTQIGGAIDLTRQIVFTDPDDDIQLVSSDAGDTENVEISYLDPADTVQTETLALTGTTPAAFTVTGANLVALLKAIKAGTTAGDVAIEAQTAEFEDDGATAFDAESVTLAGTASAVNHAYQDMVLRVTGGTGAGQIRRVVDYEGATRKVWVQADFGTTLDATSVVRISKGMVFELTPDECLEVRRICYNPQAAAAGGLDRSFYDKVFVKNLHATDDLTAAVLSEYADTPNRLSFAMETTLDGTGDNGGGNNRTVAPASGVGTFSSAAKSIVSGGTLAAGVAQGVWALLALQDGDNAADTVYGLSLGGDV